MSRIVETMWRSVLWWGFDEEMCINEYSLLCN
jgi:hypothetical protein